MCIWRYQVSKRRKRNKGKGEINTQPEQKPYVKLSAFRQGGRVTLADILPSEVRLEIKAKFSQSHA